MRKPKPALPKAKPTIVAPRPVSPGRTAKPPKSFPKVKPKPRTFRGLPIN
jgi:hypothetical protein